MAGRSNHISQRIPSPCVDICELDENDVCKGCLRTADEVGYWMVASHQEKLDILQAIEIRRATRQGINHD